MSRRDGILVHAVVLFELMEKHSLIAPLGFQFSSNIKLPQHPNTYTHYTRKTRSGKKMRDLYHTMAGPCSMLNPHAFGYNHKYALSLHNQNTYFVYTMYDMCITVLLASSGFGFGSGCTRYLSQSI